MRPAAERLRSAWGALPALAVTAVAIALCVYQLMQRAAARSSTWAWGDDGRRDPVCAGGAPRPVRVDRRTGAAALLKAQQKQQEFPGRPGARRSPRTVRVLGRPRRPVRSGRAAVLGPDYATAVE